MTQIVNSVVDTMTHMLKTPFMLQHRPKPITSYLDLWDFGDLGFDFTDFLIDYLSFFLEHFNLFCSCHVRFVLVLVDFALLLHERSGSALWS